MLRVILQLVTLQAALLAEFRAAHVTEFNVPLGDRILESQRKPSLGWADDLAAYRTATKMVRLPIRFLSVNAEALFWAAPLELFSEIALNIRRQSPFRHTSFCGFTNGWLGYRSAPKEFEEGAYEPNASPFSEYTQPIARMCFV